MRRAGRMAMRGFYPRAQLAGLRRTTRLPLYGCVVPARDGLAYQEVLGGRNYLHRCL